MKKFFQIIYSLNFILFLCICSDILSIKIKNKTRPNFNEIINDITNNIITDEEFLQNLKVNNNYDNLKFLYDKDFISFVDTNENNQDLKRSKDANNFYVKYKFQNNTDIQGINQTVLDRFYIITEEKLDRLFDKNPKSSRRVIDVGAGYGGYIENVFPKYFTEIDALEPMNNHWEGLIKLKQKVPQLDLVRKSKSQEYQFEKKYDLIFMSGILDILTDLQYLKFLIKARNALKPDGLVFIRENTNGFSANNKPFIRDNTHQKERNVEIHLLFFKLVGFEPLNFERVFTTPVTIAFDFIFQKINK